MLTLKVTGGPGEARDLEIAGERYVVGREQDADLVLAEDEEVSRHHAAFSELPDGSLTLEDLGSRNGTFVDGNRLTGPVTLSGGEEIRIGTTIFSVVAPRAGETKVAGAAGATKLAPPPATPAAAPPTPPQEPPAAKPPPPQQPPPPKPPAPAAQPPAAQPRPAFATPGGAAPASTRVGRSGRIAAIIAAVAIVLLIAGAVVMTFAVWGGVDQTLYRVGIGGGWDDATVTEFTSNCETSGADATQCGCLVDELQKRLSQGDAEEIKASNAAGSATTPFASDIADSINACNIPLTTFSS